MKKKSTILYFVLMSIQGLNTNSFGMITQEEFNKYSTTKKLSLVQTDKTSTKNYVSCSGSLPKDAPIDYDKKLAAIHGKNISSFPLSEETFNFIISKLGQENKKSFVFKTGPQIIFEDEVDLLR